MNILPPPVGSYLRVLKKGANQGKYAIYGLEGIRNSLIRFAGVKLFLVMRSEHKNTPDIIEGWPHITREEAECFIGRDFSDYFIKEITLSKDQIAEKKVYTRRRRRK